MKRGLVKSFLGLGFALTLVALALQSGPPASAHALLVGSDPPVNARLIDPPERITAQFSEPLSPALSSLQVLDGNGERVDRDDISFNPGNSREMSVGLQAQLPPAFYTVTWETLSNIDGHLLKGSFPFTILNPDGSEPTGPRLTGFGTGVSGGEPTADVVGTKWVILSASILLVGALAFVLWVVRPATTVLSDEWKQRTRDAARRHLAWVAWSAVVVLAVAGGVELLLQARQLGGLGSLDDALDTFWGERWLQRQAILATVGVALAFSLGLWRAQRPLLSEAALWVALAGGLGYLILLSMISHAGSVPGSFWAVAADFVHLVAAAVWIGMLVQLALFLIWVRQHLPEESRLPALASHLQGFSLLAATALILLLATGTFNAFAEVPTPEAMVDTAYGRVLTAKLALILPLLAVAGVNAIVLRRAVVERAESGERQGLEALKRLLTKLVAVEAALAISVLLIVAVLVQYPTSRQEAAAAEFEQISAEAVVGFEEVQETEDVAVDISIAPNIVGTNAFQIYLFPVAGEQLDEVLRIRLRFKPPDPALGPSEIIAEQVTPNFFKAVGSFFTQPGDWEVQVDIRRREADDVSTFFRVPVAGGRGGDVGGRFDFPLVAGIWGIVAAVGGLMAAVLIYLWSVHLPFLPPLALRFVRVGCIAGTLIGTVALAESFWSGAGSGGSTSGNPFPQTGQSIAIGRSLYDSSCASCHGDTGRGDGPLAAALPIPPADFRVHIPVHSDEFFFQVMTRGFGSVMPAFADSLTEEERWHILNFLQSQFGIDASAAGQGQEQP